MSYRDKNLKFYEQWNVNNKRDFTYNTARTGWGGSFKLKVFTYSPFRSENISIIQDELEGTTITTFTRKKKIWVSFIKSLTRILDLIRFSF